MPENRVGLAVMRTQPLHRGHTRIINTMIQDHRTVIVALGSSNKSGERHDPWTIEDRMTMLHNVYGRRIRIVPLNDIGSEQGSTDWCDYVLQKIADVGLPEATDYYTGSHADATWYKLRFLDEDQTTYPTEPAAGYYTPSRILRRLHILDRTASAVPSATEIRTFLETRSHEWKKWVPAVNHQIVEETYPERFRILIRPRASPTPGN